VTELPSGNRKPFGDRPFPGLTFAEPHDWSFGRLDERGRRFDEAVPEHARKMRIHGVMPNRFVGHSLVPSKQGPRSLVVQRLEPREATGIRDETCQWGVATVVERHTRASYAAPTQRVCHVEQLNKVPQSHSWTLVK
jgi:hypothetical protein